jgi:two-component sensor histidine kinase
MPLRKPIERLHDATAQLPGWARVACTLGLVGISFSVRYSLDPWFPEGGLPFLPFFPGIMLASALFARGSGYLATTFSAGLACLFIPPVGTLAITDAHNIFALGLFLASGLASACMIETLHHALEGQRAAVVLRDHAEAGRVLLLDEFRHRTRNDLQNLCALLLLRARSAPPEAREALREGAAHCYSLARVHARIAGAAAHENAAVIDTAEFLRGLCHDLKAGAAGNGLRPIAMVVEAEAHWLSTERAVHLGQLVNECVANALKYAFPAEMGGTITVRFARQAEAFALSIRDDGIGIAEAGQVTAADTLPGARDASGRGLGTRLLRALAAQLRGTFTRQAADAGGTICCLHFPTAEPGDPR